MDYIFTNFKNVLLDTGLKEISPKENDNFDVKTMEATEEVEGNDENDHKVAQLVQTGYSLHDKLLRPAKVKIYIKK
jgi:molecular chaperone GrpE